MDGFGKKQKVQSTLGPDEVEKLSSWMQLEDKDFNDYFEKGGITDDDKI